MTNRKLCECKGTLRTVIIENEHWYRCPRCNNFLSRPHDAGKLDNKKPYWIEPSTTSAHLMYGEEPMTQLVAVVCNAEWAKLLRDTLNASEAAREGAHK